MLIKETDTDKISRSTYASLCNQKTIACSKTKSDWKGYCPNSSTKDECPAEDYYFCEKSKTCIRKGENFSIFSLSQTISLQLVKSITAGIVTKVESWNFIPKPEKPIKAHKSKISL